LREKSAKRRQNELQKNALKSSIAQVVTVSSQYRKKLLPQARRIQALFLKRLHLRKLRKLLLKK
jgi:hypothetical protein